MNPPPTVTNGIARTIITRTGIHPDESSPRYAMVLSPRATSAAPTSRSFHVHGGLVAGAGGGGMGASSPIPNRMALPRCRHQTDGGARSGSFPLGQRAVVPLDERFGVLIFRLGISPRCWKADTRFRGEYRPGGAVAADPSRRRRPQEASGTASGDPSRTHRSRVVVTAASTSRREGRRADAGSPRPSALSAIGASSITRQRG
jgi:hypothetical protein